MGFCTGIEEGAGSHGTNQIVEGVHTRVEFVSIGDYPIFVDGLIGQLPAIASGFEVGSGCLEGVVYCFKPGGERIGNDYMVNGMVSDDFQTHIVDFSGRHLQGVGGVESGSEHYLVLIGRTNGAGHPQAAETTS
jgi:hypothetical protein